MAVLVVRVFGRDAVRAVRRAAAAGVRTGMSELHRDGQAGPGETR